MSTPELRSAALLIVLGALVAACDSGGRSYDLPPPTPPPTAEDMSTDAVEIGKILATTELPAGTCGTVAPEPDDSAREARVEACDEPHEFELAGNTRFIESANDPYPGHVESYWIAYQLCQPLFESHVGTAFWDSDYDLSTITPTAARWEDGDREIICLIVDVDDQPLTAAVVQN